MGDKGGGVTGGSGTVADDRKVEGRAPEVGREQARGSQADGRVPVMENEPPLRFKKRPSGTAAVSAPAEVPAIRKASEAIDDGLVNLTIIFKTLKMDDQTHVDALLTNPKLKHAMSPSALKSALESVWRDMDTPDVFIVQPVPDVQIVREFPMGHRLEVAEGLPAKEREVVLFLWVWGVVEHETKILNEVLSWIHERVVGCVSREGLRRLFCRMVRAYATLCRFANDVQRPRVFCYDLLRELTDREEARMLVGEVVKCWDAVLGKDGNTDEVYRAIRNVLEPDTSSEQTLRKYLAERVQALTDGAIDGDNDAKKFSALKAIELVALYLPWDECYEHLQVIWPLVVDNTNSVATQVVGGMGRQPLLSTAVRENIDWFREQLEEVLNVILVGDDEETKKAQESVVRVLLDLSGGDEKAVAGVGKWVKEVGRERVKGLGEGLRKDLALLGVA
ncbi:hypothetical protein HK097_007687 [Rhizophlyctis rosea]|uniref:Uncharacterized protein n=1 Tax=Rhizophlyctis rosea TaxID=64517 RepID=A0AAD5X5S0_9FUNG|nr:hypothetical protein HK097_007687 [Rhizophlyctis rosea]